MDYPADVDDLDRFKTKIPRPVPGGSYSIESMGRWIDRLLGDGIARREATAALESLLMREDEEAPEPEPLEIPAPIPGGTEPATKSADPPQERP
jgi:hypothetical protein